MYKPEQQHTNSSLVQNLCLSHLIIAVTPLVGIIIPTPDTPTSVEHSENWHSSQKCFFSWDMRDNTDHEQIPQ